MTMSDNEILRNWEGAKDKKKQIQILAELNTTSPQTIRQILVKEGVDHRLLPRERKHKEEEVKEKPAKAVRFTKTVGEILAEGIAEKKLPTVEPRHKHDFRRMAELFEAICAGEMDDKEPRPEWEEEFDELWRKHYSARFGGAC